MFITILLQFICCATFYRQMQKIACWPMVQYSSKNSRRKKNLVKDFNRWHLVQSFFRFLIFFVLILLIFLMVLKFPQQYGSSWCSLVTTLIDCLFTSINRCTINFIRYFDVFVISTWLNWNRKQGECKIW